MMGKLFPLSVLLAFNLASPPAAAQPLPVPDVSHLALPGGSLASIDSRLLRAQGEIEVVVRLGDAPLAVAVGNGAKKHGGKLTKAQQRAHVAGLSQKQDDLMRAVGGLGGRELSRLNKLLNAVILKVDASRISTIAALPNVVSIRPVVNYKLDLSETVPYIGA
jgi:minor extracellular serine protease Vpr